MQLDAIVRGGDTDNLYYVKVKSHRRLFWVCWISCHFGFESFFILSFLVLTQAQYADFITAKPQIPNREPHSIPIHPKQTSL
jgi:hypothetical protein